MWIDLCQRSIHANGISKNIQFIRITIVITVSFIYNRIIILLYGSGGMIKNLEALSKRHGDRVKLIDIRHIRELKNKAENELPFGYWSDDSREFTIPDTGFQVHSLLLIAVRHPLYAIVTFGYQGKHKSCYSPVKANLLTAQLYMERFLRAHKVKFYRAKALPLTRIGVQSEFAVYGRNEHTFIEELGSGFTYLAYYTDILCEHSSWSSGKLAKCCLKCQKCMHKCPTKAIREGGQGVDFERCLEKITVRDDHPIIHISKKSYQCIYGCIECQRFCPLNGERAEHPIGPIRFTEQDINMLLAEAPFESFSEETQEKLSLLGMNEVKKAVARNIHILLNK